jgi:hypothetical protein
MRRALIVPQVLSVRTVRRLRCVMLLPTRDLALQVKKVGSVPFYGSKLPITLRHFVVLLFLRTLIAECFLNIIGNEGFNL